MHISTLVALLGEVGALFGVVIPVMATVKKISNGTRCQLRSEMLQIYYRNKEAETLRQYELENFIMLYDAYKALKGNSFIDKIYKEVLTWEVIL